MKRLVVILAACHGATAPASHSDAPREATVHRGALADRVLLTGELQPAPAGSVDLQVPKTNREVTIRWLVDDGAHVKAGDRVLELDNSAFTEGLEQKHIASIEAIANANNAEALAKIALADKEAELEQSEIAYAKAKLQADIPADLLSAHDAQQHQLDLQRADTTLAKTKRDLVALRDGDALELHVKQLEMDKAKRAVDSAEENIKELVMIAPRDGVVVISDIPWEGRKFKVGDTVWPGFLIASMPDLAKGMEVQADLSDVDDGRVSVGMAGTCTLDAYPKDPIPCTVTALTPVAHDTNRKSLRRAFGVTLSLATNDPAHQRPGLSVKVELARPPLDNALLVPRGALIFGDKDAEVRLPGGTTRAVELGPCDAQSCAVATGVADGDKVQL